MHLTLCKAKVHYIAKCKFDTDITLVISKLKISYVSTWSLRVIEFLMLLQTGFYLCL